LKFASVRRIIIRIGVRTDVLRGGVARIRIDTPTQRLRLKVRREPHWVKLQARGYLGFRRTGDGGTWVARWRTEEGKHRYRALKLGLAAPERAYDEAAVLARAWFRQAAAGVLGRRTVREAVDRYVEALRLRSGDAAARDARGRADRVIIPNLGSRPLDRVTTAEIESWFHALVPAGALAEDTRRGKESANRNLITLKAILNYAWRTGLVASNAAWSRVRAFDRTTRAREVFLSPDQRRRLLEHSTGAFRDLTEGALLSGSRYGELRQILVSDFDRARKTLSIRQGKTGARTVPLSNAAVALFARLARSKLPTAHLFVRDDGEPWKHSDQDEAMRDAAKAARLPKGTVFYTLRHSFIASALTGGMDIYTVAKITGTSVRMIEQHYGKLLQDDARERLNKIAFA
jgi:integrase